MATPRRRGLGRGLGALIGASTPQQSASETTANNEDTEQQAKTRTEAAKDVTRTKASSQSSATSAETGSKKSKTQATQKSSTPKAKSATTKTGSAQASQSKPTSTKDDAKATKSEARTPAAKSIASNTTGRSKASEVSRETQATSASNVQGGKSARKATGDKANHKRRPVDFFFTTEADRSTEHDSVDGSGAHETRRDSRSRMSVPDVLSTRSQESVSRGTRGSAGSGDIETATAGDDLVAVPGATFSEIPVDDIHPNRKQPRQVFDEEELAELVHSIKEIGLLQPVVVRPSREEGGPRYELVMGERRWRATQEAGFDVIPAIIRETDDSDLLRDALLENLHRSQLNPLEEAAAYQQLMAEFECTQEELSERIGRSRPQISNTIRLLRLPALVQRRVAAGVLSAGHARAILALSSTEDMEKLAQRVVNEGLSVRATEELAQAIERQGEPQKRRKVAEPRRQERLDFFANQLQDRLETNVKITLGARKGKVQIDFASVDDLNRIMGIIKGETGLGE